MDTQDRLIDAMHGRAGEIYIYIMENQPCCCMIACGTVVIDSAQEIARNSRLQQY